MPGIAKLRPEILRKVRKFHAFMGREKTILLHRQNSRTE
jgi:hypothetical protein